MPAGTWCGWLPRRRGIPGPPTGQAHEVGRSGPPALASSREVVRVDDGRMLSRRSGLAPVTRSSLQNREGPHRSCRPNGSPLGLRSSVGSSRVREYSPHRGSHGHGRPSLGVPCEPTRSLPPTRRNVRTRRRIAWPMRVRPRSPFRRGSAYIDHPTLAFAADQSEFPRIEAHYFHAGEGDPSGLPGGSRRYLPSTGSAVPTGRGAHRPHVHANRDLATLLRRDRDRSTGPRHLPRAEPFDGDLRR